MAKTFRFFRGLSKVFSLDTDDTLDESASNMDQGLARTRKGSAA